MGWGGRGADLRSFQADVIPDTQIQSQGMNDPEQQMATMLLVYSCSGKEVQATRGAGLICWLGPWFPCLVSIRLHLHVQDSSAGPFRGLLTPRKLRLEASAEYNAGPLSAFCKFNVKASLGLLLPMSGTRKLQHLHPKTGTSHHAN